MTFFDDYAPELPTRDEVSVGPDADFFASLSAQFSSDQVNQHQLAKDNALTRARRERADEISKMMGTDYTQVIRPYLDDIVQTDQVSRDARGVTFDQEQLEIRSREFTDVLSPEDRATDRFINDLRMKGTAPQLLSSIELRQRAKEIALEEQLAAGDMAARTPGLSGQVARLAASAGSSMTQPAQLMLLPLGAGAQTVRGAMAVEGLIGAAGSAAVQPSIAKWQKELGLETTLAEQAGTVAFDAAVSAGTAGLLKGGGVLISKMLTARKAVDAFDRAFPTREDAPRDLVQRRDALEVMAEIAEDNPLAATPQGEAEHLQRMIAVEQAVRDGEPLPRFKEDAVETRPPVRIEAEGKKPQLEENAADGAQTRPPVAKVMQDDAPRSKVVQQDAQSASWVIRRKEDKEVLFETFDRKKVDALNTDKYEAVPIQDYLGSINGRQKTKPSSLETITAAWPAKGIDAFVSEKNGIVTVAKIVVPKAQRGNGLGTAATQEIIDYADVTGQIVALTPSADFGGNVGRLKSFYKRFGFVPNKGRSKEFATTESFVRYPKKSAGRAQPLPGQAEGSGPAPADVGTGARAVNGDQVVDDAPLMPEEDVLTQVFDEPDLATVKAQLDAALDVSDLASIEKLNEAMEADLRARVAAGDKPDVSAASDGAYETVDDMLADLDAEKEFTETIKVCLT